MQQLLQLHKLLSSSEAIVVTCSVVSWKVKVEVTVNNLEIIKCLNDYDCCCGFFVMFHGRLCFLISALTGCCELKVLVLLKY